MHSFLDGKVIMHPGDCLDALAVIPADSLDSCVTDPPYGLGEPPDPLVMLQAWLAGDVYEVASKSAGFMGKEWDSFVPQPAHWKAILRVLKPGAHVLSFFGTRTYDLGVLAMRLAGFEIRDSLQWLYGSGFPKGVNVGKAIDEHFGVEREVIGLRTYGDGQTYQGGDESGRTGGGIMGEAAKRAPSMATVPATPEAAQWEGWNTALKPACEPLVLARKPLSEKTVHQNVLRWGTGALNIDGCRVATCDNLSIGAGKINLAGGRGGVTGGEQHSEGRWPANVVHDGSADVVDRFPQADGGRFPAHGGSTTNVYGKRAGVNQPARNMEWRGEGGSAARFFYNAKADAFDRMTSDHPTIKPVDLMQYLSRMVTPAGGTLIDPFAGTGTTGEAAWREGLHAILIERDPVYQEHIIKRMAMAFTSDRERRVTVNLAKVAKGKKKQAVLPLFEG